MPRETHGNYPNQTATTCATLFKCQCFTKYGNLQAINITTLHFCIWQHMGRNHSETELQHLATLPSIPVHKVYQHLLNNFLTIDTLQNEAIRRYKYSMEPVCPPQNIHFSFRFTYTSRNRIILLLFLLVLTCQISMPTFKIR